MPSNIQLTIDLPIEIFIDVCSVLFLIHLHMLIPMMFVILAAISDKEVDPLYGLDLEGPTCKAIWPNFKTKICHICDVQEEHFRETAEDQAKLLLLCTHIPHIHFMVSIKDSLYARGDEESFVVPNICFCKCRRSIYLTRTITRGRTWREQFALSMRG